MAIIKNAILSPIQRLIGMAPSPSPTVLDDDSVSLTMPIVPHIARRSLVGKPNGGWFEGVLENVHSGADDEQSSINPYAAGLDAVPPYPMAINDNFDIWLIAVMGRRSSGAGGLTGAIMTIDPPTHSQGWGRDDVGAPVVGSPPMRVAFFDGVEETVAGITPSPMITEQGLLLQPINLRIPHDALLTFHSTSAAAAEFQAIFLVGLFPAGLGQDIAT